MPDAQATLRYHGRRLIDELGRAVDAETSAIARIHKALALLHLDRFVEVAKAVADSVPCGQLSATETGLDAT